MSLSVLLPVYGEANFISEAIISTLDNIEITDELIIILDRTSDNTKAIIEDFASKDARIVMINSPSPGITSALNFGITYSDADFIARMDADDVVINNRFKLQKKFLEAHPKYILIGSNIQLIDTSGRKIGLKVYPSGNNSIKRMLFYYNPIAHPTVMIRRIFLLKSGLYKIGTDGYEDFYLWKKLSNFGKFKNSRKCFLKYRIHDNQISKQKNRSNSLSEKNYYEYLNIQNKRNYRLISLYMGIINKKNRSLISVFNSKFILDYFASLVYSPKSTLTLSYYYIVNAIVSKIHLKLSK